MFVYTQEDWVLDVTNSNMDGNTGWSEVDGDATEINPRDSRGLPHYKLVNGELVEDETYPEPEETEYISDSVRLDVIEAVLLEMMEE